MRCTTSSLFNQFPMSLTSSCRNFCHWAKQGHFCAEKMLVEVGRFSANFRRFQFSCFFRGCESLTGICRTIPRGRCDQVPRDGGWWKERRVSEKRRRGIWEYRVSQCVDGSRYGSLPVTSNLVHEPVPRAIANCCLSPLPPPTPSPSPLARLYILLLS